MLEIQLYLAHNSLFLSPRVLTWAAYRRSSGIKLKQVGKKLTNYVSQIALPANPRYKFSSIRKPPLWYCARLGMFIPKQHQELMQLIYTRNITNANSNHFHMLDSPNIEYPLAIRVFFLIFLASVLPSTL